MKESKSNRSNRSQRGSAVLLFALMLPVLLGFVGLAVDFGNEIGARRQAQNAADAAALAGVVDLTTSTSQACADALNYLSKNGYTSGNATCPANIVTNCPSTSSIPPGITVCTSSPCQNATPACSNDTILVTTSQTVNLIFMRVLGLSSGTVGANAEARMEGAIGGGFPFAVWNPGWAVSTYVCCDGAIPQAAGTPLPVNDNAAMVNPGIAAPPFSSASATPTPYPCEPSTPCTFPGCLASTGGAPVPNCAFPPFSCDSTTISSTPSPTPGAYLDWTGVKNSAKGSPTVAVGDVVIINSGKWVSSILDTPGPNNPNPSAWDANSAPNSCVPAGMNGAGVTFNITASDFKGWIFPSSGGAPVLGFNPVNKGGEGQCNKAKISLTQGEEIVVPMVDAGGYAQGNGNPFINVVGAVTGVVRNSGTLTGCNAATNISILVTNLSPSPAPPNATFGACTAALLAANLCVPRLIN